MKIDTNGSPVQRLILRLLALSCLTVPSWSLAHDSPATVISQLTATMAREGVSADLFFRRATEFRAIRYYQRAAYDLTQALAINNTMIAARIELARLQLQNLGKKNRVGTTSPLSGDPLTTLSPLISHHDRAVRAAAVALRGEIHSAKQQWKEAVDDFTKALSVEANVAWFLWRAEAQLQIGLYKEAIEGLSNAYALTQSPVVQKMLCDTYIAVAKKMLFETSSSEILLTKDFYLEQATKIIENELVENRLKSSWQIRSGKVLILRGESHQASQQLHKALGELHTRLETPYTDPALVEDRKIAEALLAECEIPLR